MAETMIEVKLEPGAVFSFGRRFWKILEIDETERTIFVRSYVSIGEDVYHDQDCDITWENCSLRKSLNTRFLQEEFTEQEREAILVSHVENNDHTEFGTEGGNDTEDRIFLLSQEEVYRYRINYTTDETDYPIDVASKFLFDHNSMRLRSPGSFGNRTMVLSWQFFPSFTMEERTVDDPADLYPAFRLNMDSESVRSIITVQPSGERTIRSRTMFIENGRVTAVNPMLTEASLPADVVEIADYAFSDCKNLKTVTWPGPAPKFTQASFFLCPEMKLPESYYIDTWQPPEWTAEYMPVTPKLLALCLSDSDNIRGSFYTKLVTYLNEENAAATADCILEQFQETYAVASPERLLRFTLAAAPVLGKERMEKLFAVLKTIYPPEAKNMKLVKREVRLADQPSTGKISNGLLDLELVPYDIMNEYDNELKKLPQFAAILNAVLPYYEQLHRDEDDFWFSSMECVSADPSLNDCTGWSIDLTGWVIGEFYKREEHKTLLGNMDHASLMHLLKRWADRIDDGWYIPYTVYADDQELGALLKEIKTWDKRRHLECIRDIYGALLMNESLTAMRFADQAGLLPMYALIHKKDEDKMRDDHICDFGLDPQGKRSWTLSDKIMTASLNKDLTVTLTDEKGLVYRSMPKIGSDEQYSQVVREYRDLEENILATAGVRNARIFDDFLSGRRRTASYWKKYYMGNGLLRILAEKIVWDQEGSTFILDENGQPVTADGTPYTLTDARIAVAHPMEMGKAVTETWQRYVLEHRLKQPFEQVWEPVDDPEQVTRDRYAGYPISLSIFENKTRDGIKLKGRETELKECRASLEPYGDYIDWKYEIRQFTYDMWDRQVNHITVYLNKCLVTARIEEDDISAMKWIGCFTPVQIIEFINTANKAQAHNVLIYLLDYKNTHFGDFDLTDDFKLDE